MFKPQQKSIATLVLLVLAANAALYFNPSSWWSSVAPGAGADADASDVNTDSAAITRTLMEEHELSPSEFTRRLAHEPAPLENDNGNANTDNDVDIDNPRARVMRGLESRGLEPGTELYARALDKRVNKLATAKYNMHELIWSAFV